MKLGEIQERWLHFIEENPELQGVDGLGVKTDTKECYCILGVGLLLVYASLGLTPLYSNDGSLIENKGFGNPCFLSVYHKNLGLKDRMGSIDGGVLVRGKVYKTLAELNDDEIKWSEIIEIIRRAPEKIFAESL